MSWEWLGRSAGAGKRQQVLEQDLGSGGPPSFFWVSCSWSAAEITSPIHTFPRVTDQPIIPTHAVTQFAPLQVKRGGGVGEPPQDLTKSSLIHSLSL